MGKGGKEVAVYEFVDKVLQFVLKGCMEPMLKGWSFYYVWWEGVPLIHNMAGENALTYCQACMLHLNLVSVASGS